MSQWAPEKSWTMHCNGGANATLLLACLFETDIQESLVQCCYTSRPADLWWIECAKITAEIKRSPGLGWCKCLRCVMIEGTSLYSNI